MFALITDKSHVQCCRQRPTSTFLEEFTCGYLQGKLHVHDSCQFWSICFLVRGQYVRQTKCLKFRLEVGSCCQSSRRLVFHRRRHHWSSFLQEGKPIAPAATGSIWERWTLLQKWSSSEDAVLENIDPSVHCTWPCNISWWILKDFGSGMNSSHEHFHLVVMALPPQKELTKRSLTSDIRAVFDILGLIAPVTLKAK